MLTPFPKLIAFDIDNTLIYGQEATRFYTQYGRALEQAFAQTQKIPLTKAKQHLDTYRRAYDGRGELAFDALGISFCVYDAICSLDPKGHIPLMTDSITLLKSLAPHTRLLAITDGPIEQAYRLLEETGISAQWFSEIIGWQREKKKPKEGTSKIFENILLRYNLQPQEFMMVGDTWSVDIEPVKRLGGRTIHIGTKPNSIKDISFLLQQLYD